MTKDEWRPIANLALDDELLHGWSMVNFAQAVGADSREQTQGAEKRSDGGFHELLGETLSSDNSKDSKPPSFSGTPKPAPPQDPEPQQDEPDTSPSGIPVLVQPAPNLPDNPSIQEICIGTSTETGARSEGSVARPAESISDLPVRSQLTPGKLNSDSDRSEDAPVSATPRSSEINLVEIVELDESHETPLIGSPFTNTDVPPPIERLGLSSILETHSDNPANAAGLPETNANGSKQELSGPDSPPNTAEDFGDIEVDAQPITPLLSPRSVQVESRPPLPSTFCSPGRSKPSLQEGKPTPAQVPLAPQISNQIPELERGSAHPIRSESPHSSARSLQPPTLVDAVPTPALALDLPVHQTPRSHVSVVTNSATPAASLHDDVPPPASSNLLSRLGREDLTIGLRTGEFGRIEIHTTIEHDRVGAVVTVHDSGLRDSLQSDIGNLSRALSEHSLELTNFQAADSGAHPQSRRQHEFLQGGTRDLGREPGDPPVEALANMMSAHSGMLDLRA